jgi:mono/diheme cytochrome c family protein
MFHLVVLLALLGLGADARNGAVAQQPAAPPTATSSLDVTQLFATTCGWCHSDGGRAPGKGPQLINTARRDDFMRTPIKIGKEGHRP